MANMDYTNDSQLVQLVNETARKAVGFESYADVTEFYDEDGCVVMVVQELDEGRILIQFAEGNETFECEPQHQLMACRA